jgi:16S rRNA (guanine527-N7)-methyltransferase
VTAARPFVELLSKHAAGADLDRLSRFAELVERWSKRHNLVRYGSREELVGRHIVDALSAAPQFGAEGSLLDVGSGAGLPGVPLLAVRPAWRGVLLEPRQKRWAFLRTVVRELGLRAEVVRARYEDFDDDRQFDFVTCRALAGHPALLRWARNRLTASGAVLLWTTADGLDALGALAGWHMLSSQLPGLENGRLARLQPCFT